MGFLADMNHLELRLYKDGEYKGMRHKELEKKVAQLFTVGFSGTRVPDEVANLISQGLGGVILFERNLPNIDTAFDLLDELYEKAKGRPLVVGIDQEGGRVQRMGPPVLQLPSMRILGRLNNAQLCYEAGCQLASELRALGFHINYAPVLDVDSNPNNRVIADRAFGSDPDKVIQLGLAFASGLQKGGLVNSAKHFPGHGDTALDSHKVLPHISHKWKRLRIVELSPFYAACNARVDSIMVAHMLVHTIDSTQACSLSKNTYCLLRGDVGFNGVVLTDDLEMGAVAENPGVVAAAVQALSAGADHVLICHHPELAAQAMLQMIHAIEVRSSLCVQIKTSLERLARLHARVSAGHRRPSKKHFNMIISSRNREQLEKKLQSLFVCE
jgi:beta-N-acetylhexosaminidase